MYKERYEALGTAIKFYRVSKNINQGQLAEQIGITPQYLSKIEHGAAKPSMDLLFTIADSLQLPAAKLLAEDK